MIGPDAWRPSGGLVLEPNALVAVHEAVHSLALTAGPGAGKTEMLAQKADFLLRTGSCRYPRRILAISFKVDASRNLKERVRKRCGPELAARLDSHTFHAFAKRIVDRFRPVLTGSNALDVDYNIGDTKIAGRQIRIDDLIPLALNILQRCVVARNAIRQTYSHVFLDEFQDCTADQYQLICAAFYRTNASITAVGDTKQRIMGFAGALEGIFSSFAADFHALPLNLYQNFRSLPRLRRVQNAMVEIMDPAAAVRDGSLAGDGGEISKLFFANSDDESLGIASMIADWIAVESLSPSQIAVLVSKQAHLYCNKLVEELNQRGIPFRNEQKVQDLAAEPAARIIVDFLSVVIGERQPAAFGRLMSSLLASDMDEQAFYRRRSQWLRYVDGKRRQMQQGGVRPTARSLRVAVADFLTMLDRPMLIGMSPDYEQGDRLDDVVERTLDHIDELLSLDPEPIRALSRFGEDNAVRIMTIHKSKGLEFDSVVMLGIENETFFGKLKDERCAFFVGISRARRRLVLTASNHRERPAGHSGRWAEQRTAASEFLGYADVR